MRKEQVLPAIVTIAILSAVVLWTSLRSNNEPTQKNSKPDEVVWALVRSCREGDVEGYLNCFGSPMKEKLERSLKEQGSEKFRSYIQQLIVPVKGIAVFEPKRNAQGNWQVVVEFVFSDRTERQVFLVRKIGNEWKIVGVESSKPVPVLIPYGTPVKGL
ncbi:hypothetical protein HRbin17_02362 [bacterium HR17]|jgi:hypothetical protein|uniref:DUF4878 domain-containing protein n=1 Tax=Candidatus Fervidibacter japonicus TaxID=2035412 RepID=A0A2H5XF76_9BACT|nr:hypothetical protein HRbin17_02362 [bacterium HR17]